MSASQFSVCVEPDSLLHSGSDFHLNILNQVRFHQREELRDQYSQWQTSLEKTTTLLGAQALKHKFDILSAKAKNSENTKLQESKECQAFKWLLSGEKTATEAW